MPALLVAAASKLPVLRPMRAQHHADNLTEYFAPAELFIIGPSQRSATAGRTRLPSLRRRLSGQYQVLRTLRRPTLLANGPGVPPYQRVPGATDYNFPRFTGGMTKTTPRMTAVTQNLRALIAALMVLRYAPNIRGEKTADPVLDAIKVSVCDYSYLPSAQHE